MAAGKTSLLIIFSIVSGLTLMAVPCPSAYAVLADPLGPPLEEVRPGKKPGPPAATQKKQQIPARKSKKVGAAPEESPLKTGEEYLSEGDGFLESGRFDQAISAYSRALEKNLKDNSAFYAYHSRGYAYYKVGRNDQALEDLNHALSKEPKSFKTYHVRALVYARKGQYALSLADFNKLLALNPQYALGYFNKAVVCERAGLPQEALEAYNKFLQQAPPEEGERRRKAQQKVNLLGKGRSK